MGMHGYLCLHMCLQAAAAQLGKVETLIGIGQYDSARLQLRQGAASTIRLDLRAYDRSQHAKPGDPQVPSKTDVLSLIHQYLQASLIVYAP